MGIHTAYSGRSVSRHLSAPPSWLTALLCLAGSVAHAETYTVGTPVAAGQCTHATVQAAVAAAAVHPGADVIRVTRTQSWTAQQISINSDQDLDILGGFATCTSAATDGTRTTLDGTGGDPRPVFAIRGSGIVRLRDLTITGGDQDGDDNGGGIYYEGGGELNIADSLITDNVAYDGGGIYAVGTTDQSELVLGANVIVSFNVARKSGGGVVANSLEMSLRGPGSSLMFNEAHGDGGNGGNGGGLAVVSDQFRSYAYVSSNGIGGIGAIYANTAVNGAGIAVLGGENSHNDSIAEVFSTTSTADVLVNGNNASGKGGAIYLHTDADNGGDAVARALLRNATIDDNTAADGAAFYLDYDPGFTLGFDFGSKVYFDDELSTPPISPDAAPCPFGRPCGFITNNTATSNGAVIRIVSWSDFTAHRLAIQNNGGGRLAYLTDTSGGVNTFTPSLRLFDSLLTGNATTQELVRQAGDGGTTLDHVTLADNQPGTSYVLHLEGSFNVTRSLVSQPGLTLFESAPPTDSVSLVVSNDATLAGANTYASPRFVDPERGDYNLQAGSVAVDYAPVAASDTAGDINSHTRNLDLPNIPNQAGPGDAGAFEREHFDPLVLNADFDQDLHRWDAIGSAQWDATQNVTGATGSGSLKATLGIDDSRLVARAQCVHIPGPGSYLLNGWGRASHGTPFHNQARLAWELRRNGSVFGCTDGAPDVTGEFVLADDTAWHKPADGATIDVPEAFWGNNTSLTIYVVGINGNPIARSPTEVDGGGPDAWFDGITLERVLGDSIFANGFELP